MTAKAQPNTRISQIAGPNAPDCLPEPDQPTTFSGHVPRPSVISTNVPKNSASMAPGSPARNRVYEVVFGGVAFAVNVTRNPQLARCLGSLRTPRPCGNPLLVTQAPRGINALGKARRCDGRRQRRGRVI